MRVNEQCNSGTVQLLCHIRSLAVKGICSPPSCSSSAEYLVNVTSKEINGFF